MLEQHGLLTGGILLFAVSAWAFLLGRKAAKGVRSFREEQHERFTGRERA